MTPLRESVAAQTISVVPVINTNGDTSQVPDTGTQVLDPHTSEHMATEEAPAVSDPNLSPGSTDYQIINTLKPEPEKPDDEPKNDYSFMNVTPGLKPRSSSARYL